MRRHIDTIPHESSRNRHIATVVAALVLSAAMFTSAFIMARFPSAVTPAQFRGIGHKRMQEAKNAAHVLGLSSNDLIFLGYPDGGLSDIFMNVWTSKPYRSGVTNAASVPYAESAVAGQPQTAMNPVSYTHLRAHETRHDLVCR